MLTMLRYLLLACGTLAALPLLAVLLLLLSTPITFTGGLYLFACLLIAAGMICAPWWRQRSSALLLFGATLILAVITLRIVFPPAGARLALVSLPGQAAPRWLNRIFDEQDVAVFGAQVAIQAGAVSPKEADALVPTLAQAYAEMRSQGATPLSPFLMTYLKQQQPGAFDAIIAEAALDRPAKVGIIFLHGYGGNFALQCWLIAQAGDRIGAVTVCPSTGRYGDWWTPQGAATVQATLAYFQQRGVQRMYLAGLSNGGLGASQLAQRFESDLAGLILISGADPAAPITALPVLVVQGSQDERMPAAFVARYVAAAGPNSTYRLFDGDHFVLLKQAGQVQRAIGDWLIEQEDG